jgi:hypothetical protein
MQDVFLSGQKRSLQNSILEYDTAELVPYFLWLFLFIVSNITMYFLSIHFISLNFISLQRLFSYIMAEKKIRIRIELRCSQEKKAELKEKAKSLNLTLSQYLLRDRNAQFNTSELLKLVEEVSYNDNKLDNNVNQIAKNFNTNGFVVDDNVLKELLNLLSSVGKKREDLITKLNKLIKILSE